jgi:hypothetical protein
MYDPSQFEEATTKWFSYFGSDGLAALPDHEPEVVQFVQRAHIIFEDSDDPGEYIVFFWVNNLAVP